MKTTFTTIFFSLALVFCFSIGLNAQTTHNVSISGVSFVPGGLTIDQGDEVVWTNSTGVGHNVNGTTATFSSNPESFGNSVSTSWTYSHTFNIPGSYVYQCDPHSGAGMLGQLTVNATPTGIEDADTESGIKVYPNPATSIVNFDFTGISDIEEEMEISLFNAIGAKLKSVKTNGLDKLSIETVDLPAGMYLYQIEANQSVLKTGKLMVK